MLQSSPEPAGTSMISVCLKVFGDNYMLSKCMFTIFSLKTKVLPSENCCFILFVGGGSWTPWMFVISCSDGSELYTNRNRKEFGSWSRLGLEPADHTLVQNRKNQTGPNPPGEKVQLHPLFTDRWMNGSVQLLCLRLWFQWAVITEGGGFCSNNRP